VVGHTRGPSAGKHHVLSPTLHPTALVLFQYSSPASHAESRTLPWLLLWKSPHHWRTDKLYIGGRLDPDFCQHVRRASKWCLSRSCSSHTVLCMFSLCLPMTVRPCTAANSCTRRALHSPSTLRQQGVPPSPSQPFRVSNHFALVLQSRPWNASLPSRCVA
jgi:hypothetical protein